MALALAAASPAWAESRQTTIEIVGSLRVHAARSVVGDTTRVRGLVEDELGRALPSVQFTLVGVDSHVCDSQGAIATSAADGSFCLETEAGEVLSLQATHPGFETLVLTLRDESRDGELEVLYAPRIIDLGTGRSESVTVRHPITPSTPLELLARYPDETKIVAQSSPWRSGQTDLVFSARDLPGPGPFEWQIRQGEAESARVGALAQAKVTLNTRIASESRTTLVLSVTVDAASWPAASGRVATDLPGDTSVSTEVRDGRAELEIPKGPKEAHLLLHFVPLHPEYLAGPAVAVTVPPRGPLLPPWILHATLAGGFVVWFLRRWVFRRELVEGAPSGSDQEGLAILEPASSSSPLHGQVLDGHTGEPIAEAEIVLTRVGAATETLLERTRSDREGRFAFSSPSAGLGSQALDTQAMGPHALVVECRGYRPVRSAVGDGKVRVYLIESRRALLADLVRWARRAGSPWTHSRAPTPLEAARAARDAGLEEEAVWAQRLNELAFGPQDTGAPSTGEPPKSSAPTEPGALTGERGSL